jgi:hypothetical protein
MSDVELADLIGEFVVTSRQFEGYVRALGRAVETNCPAEEIAGHQRTAFKVLGILIQVGWRLRAALIAAGQETLALTTLLTHLQDRNYDAALKLSAQVRPALLDLADRLRNPQATAPEGNPPGDESAYVPAKELLVGRLRTHKQLLGVLKRHPEIRTKRPNRQRLQVHVGDLRKALSEENESEWAGLDRVAEPSVRLLKDLAQTREEARSQGRTRKARPLPDLGQ